MFPELFPGMAVLSVKFLPDTGIRLFQQQQNMGQGFHPQETCLSFNSRIVVPDIGINHFRMLGKMECPVCDLLRRADGNAARTVIIVIERAVRKGCPVCGQNDSVGNVDFARLAQ